MSSSADSLQMLRAAIALAPPGKWAVAVSGGADSVALLRLLALDASPSRELTVVHLNHQTRGEASDADERFVVELARELSLPLETDRRESFESTALPANPSARYRAMRHALFARVIRERSLEGVLLAHHADDQAETVLLRLLRGSGWTTLAGMSMRTTINGITIVRPLLNVRRDDLRNFLRGAGHEWREDASNASSDYERNVVRAALRDNEQLFEPLMNLSARHAELRDWADRTAPRLTESFAAHEIAGAPRVLAAHAIARWLRERDVPSDSVSAQLIDAIIAMCTDASTPAKINLPGAAHARRRGGNVFVQRIADDS